MIATAATNNRKRAATAKVALIPAVGYIRMSKDEQVHSPKQQKDEVLSHAKKHGYKIVIWYQDNGITGDSIEKRPQFCKMLADAQTSEWKVILCWDMDRFGRFDSITAGAVIHPLREAGVRLETIAQGKIDWHDFAGRIMYALQQEGKYQYLVDLSRNVLRGQIAANKRRDWPTGPPLGYDRQYFDAAGAKVRLVPYGENFAAPPDWRCRLALSSDPERVELIRWIFAEFTTKETSYTGIAKTLERRGVKPPKGLRWGGVTIKIILRNPAYLGHTVLGKTSVGKYHRIGADGGIATKAEPRGVVRCDNTHTAIVDQETFDKAHRKAAHRAATWKKVNASDYHLSGLLRCGHCGGGLNGSYNNTIDRRYYRCAAGVVGRGCRSYGVTADAIEEFMLGMVHDQILGDDHIERLRTEILAKAKKRQPTRASAAKSIKAKLAKLEAKIRKGTERLLLIDDDAAEDASLLLAEWREERASLKAQLSSKGNGGDVRPLTPEAKAARAIDKLMALRKGIKEADSARLRYVFRQIFSEVRLWWTPRPVTRHSTGKLRRYRFSKGQAILASDDEDGDCILNLSESGSRSCFNSLPLASRRAT